MQRESCDVSEDFVASAQSFQFDKMKPSGGKGGDYMVWTADGKYIVKEVNDTDQKALLKVTESYVEHVIGENGTSLIARFFLHFHRFEDGKDYVVMGNCLPKPKLFRNSKGEMAPKVNYTALYDLKGCRDDKALILDGDEVEEVHMRYWHSSF